MPVLDLRFSRDEGSASIEIYVQEELEEGGDLFGRSLAQNR